MSEFQKLSPDQLAEKRTQLQARYAEFQSRKLALDMTRGKPAAAQLDLAAGLLDLPGAGDYKDDAGTDCRNYGGLEGLPAVRALFAEFLEVPAEQVIIGGNASLTMMHDTVLRALTHGVPVAESRVGEPWSRQNGGKIRFLCPSPGYDRHFSICEHQGIEMIPVGIDEAGPDMDRVEELVAQDETIKGIWCVPKYSNPTGVTYSDAVVDRLAKMKTAAADFRIFWDNAYAVHHLGDTPDRLKNIYTACESAGNADRVLIFGSTSKITLAGSGLAVFGASPANIADAKKHLAMQTIGPDKINQLRHLRFLKDMAGVAEHMRKHAAIIKPKFDAVLKILDQELGGAGIATWTRPNGGYFISLDTPPGCAAEVVKMAADAGVKLTGAGATFPYRKDPNDSNIRIAPTLPPPADIATASEVVAVCVQLSALQKLLP
ncbi:MAG: aminotransferase class I/II-fold pyridoxal phosphate-dependent enzyme [bacterium]|nr:aminotransferase class I/II-fold pyridoxal phosphate-dependent enzyme [bacterium]